jgi:hypothetical protein
LDTRRRAQMPRYTFRVEQTIEVIASSYQSAESRLPLYPEGFEGGSWTVVEEKLELLEEAGING